MLQPLDPAIVPFIDAFPPLALTPDRLRELRAMPAMAFPLSDAVERTDHVIDAETGVIVRVHRPKAITGPLPCVLSIHGGGYVIGSYTMDDTRFDRWAPLLPCVGVSVEYRLAPETPYPGPLEDCYAALRWTHEHAVELGIDRDRLGVFGVSAGGGLAAALALLARDRGELALAFQLLSCPMIDDRRVTPSSRLDGLSVWTREDNEFGWRSYLADLYGAADVPYTAAPARAIDLSGLPPAFVSVGSVDGFRDEDIDYATRLNQAGVPTELHVYPGAPHGLAMAVGTAVALQEARDAEEWLARQLA